MVDGEYPKAAELKDISSLGSYLFLTDDAMDLVSQFSSLNFVIHFALHNTRYPSVLSIAFAYLQLLHVLLPFLSESHDSDTYEYLSILQSFYPSSHAFSIHYRDDFPHGLTCFRELVSTLMYCEIDDPDAHSLLPGRIDPSGPVRSGHRPTRSVSLLSLL